MKACIIIPCYNEEKRIDSKEFIQFIKASPHTILFVNDGSTDDTLGVLERIQLACNKRAIVVSVPKNGGKAEAVRFGMHMAVNDHSYDYLGYLDSDLATPLSEMANMIEYKAANPHYRMVMAIRLKRLGSKVNRSLKRHYLGRVFATLVSLLLGLPTYDTQCGAKIINRDLAAVIFKEPFVSPWLFDVELLFRIKKEKGVAFANAYVYEYPLMVWNEVWGSKLSLGNYLQAPFELLKIWRVYR